MLEARLIQTQRNTDGKFKLHTLALSLLVLALLSGCAKPTEEEYIARAESALTTNENLRAIIELKNALLLNNNNGEARWLLGKTYLATRDGLSAEKELRRAQDLGVATTSIFLPLAQAYAIQGNHQNILDLSPPATLPILQQARFAALQGDAFFALDRPDAAQRAFEEALALHPDSLEAIVGIAILKTAQNKIDDARVWLDKAQQLNAHYAPAWRQLAQIEQQEGHFDKALAAYTQAIESTHNNSIDLVRRALLHLQSKQIKDAKADLALAQKNTQQRFPLMDFASGLIAMQETRLDNAIETFQKILENSPHYSPAKFYLGLCMYQTKQFEQASSLLESFLSRNPNSIAAKKILGGTYLALGNKERAIGYLRQVIASDPSDTETLKILGLLALENKAPDEAINFFRKVADNEAENADNFIRLGLGYSAAKRPGAARKEYNRAIALNPELIEAELGILGSYINNNEYKSAFDYVAKLQQERPNDTDPLVMKSAVHLALGDKQAARQALEQALKLSPANPSISNNLATIALQDGDLGQAIELYQETIALHPEHTPSLMGLARLELITGNEEKALSIVQQALKVAPNNIEIRSTLATYYLKKNQANKASEIIEEADQQHSDNTRLLEIRAKTQIALGQYEQARGTTSRLLELQPQSAEGYFLLAKLNGQTNNGDAVLANLTKTLQLNPNHFDAKIILARIYSNNGAFDRVSAILDTLPQEYDSHPQILYLKGLRELRQKHPQPAYGFFIEAQAIEPRSEFIISTSVAEFHLGKIEDGLKTLRTWLTDNPKDLAVQYHLANSLLLLKRNTAAEKALRDTLRIQPNNLGALNNLAWLLIEKSPTEAEKLITEALVVAPNSLHALDTLAIIKLNNGQAERALDLLNKASTIDSNDPLIMYHLALALQKTGSEEKAQDLFEKLLSRGTLPDDLRLKIKASRTTD